MRNARNFGPEAVAGRPEDRQGALDAADPSENDARQGPVPPTELPGDGEAGFVETAARPSRGRSSRPGEAWLAEGRAARLPARAIGRQAAHGEISSSPAPSKSPRLRVASRAPCVLAIAAIIASGTDIGRPLRVLSPIRTP